MTAFVSQIMELPTQERMLIEQRVANDGRVRSPLLSRQAGKGDLADPEPFRLDRVPMVTGRRLIDTQNVATKARQTTARARVEDRDRPLIQQSYRFRDLPWKR